MSDQPKPSRSILVRVLAYLVWDCLETLAAVILVLLVLACYDDRLRPYALVLLPIGCFLVIRWFVLRKRRGKTQLAEEAAGAESEARGGLDCTSEDN